jgi:hypothetical protein
MLREVWIMPIWLWIVLLIAVLVGGPVAVLVGMVMLGGEAGRRRAFPFIRPLYKHVFNPRVLDAAARHETSWGVLHHVGRRSGTAYDTPIDAQRTPRGVFIPLVYGAGSDWCRNVLAADQCRLTLDGQDLALIEPKIVPLATAEPQLSPEKARFWHRIGIEHCLSLQLAPEPERT